MGSVLDWACYEMTLISQCCRILKGVDEFSITAVVLTAKQIKGLHNCILLHYTVTDAGCTTEHAECPSNSEYTVDAQRRV